jgi:hypothetical protein
LVAENALGEAPAAPARNRAPEERAMARECKERPVKSGPGSVGEQAKFEILSWFCDGFDRADSGGSRRRAAGVHDHIVTHNPTAAHYRKMAGMSGEGHKFHGRHA